MTRKARTSIVDSRLIPGASHGPGRRLELLLAPTVISLTLTHPAVARSELLAELHRMLPADASHTQAVALGDVDGDGDLDAWVGNSGPNRLLLNDGNGVFAEAATSPQQGALETTSAVVLGDVDGDGDLDALIGTSSAFGGGTTQNRLYLNDGSGVFTDATANLPVDPDWANALALGDVDGDGDLDLLIGNGKAEAEGGSLPEQDRLYLNDGFGVFADATDRLPTYYDFTHAVGLEDVDGDGDLDVLIGTVDFSFGGKQNRLYVNDGAGFFSDATAGLPPQTDTTHAVALGDVDGDGDVDALVGNSGCNRLYLNDGTGVFEDASSGLPPDADVTQGVALEDVDGDGDLDALIANGDAELGSGYQNRLYLNDGGGVFVAAQPGLPGDLDSSLSVALGDVDGDDDSDLLVGNAGSGGSQNRLYLNDGNGGFTDATAPPPTDPDWTHAVALGDVDGDGDADALIGNYLQNRLYLNDGTGVFGDATAGLPPDSSDSRAVAMGDVDGDGDLDALVGNSAFAGGAQNRLYLNDGSGVFLESAAGLPAYFDSTRALALGDLDGDGDLDLLIGNGYPDYQDRLYLNDGTGVFAAAPANLPVDFDSTYAIALGDVDGDGDLDAMIGNSGQNRLYLNNGGGILVDSASSLPAQLDDTRAVMLGDVDGDGDLDALIGNSGQNRLYLNDGTGAFADGTAGLPADSDQTHSLSLGDMDGDQDLDVVIGNWQAQNRLYLNDGGGLFVDATADLPVDSNATSAVAVGDVDGDQDLDVLVGNYSHQSRLYTNITRQLAWRGLPRVGKTLTLDLHGPAGAPWFLARSSEPAYIAFPPYGTLQLSPASLTVVGSGWLDAGGLASVNYQVPSLPTLVGGTRYWQALIGPELGFSNLERTTLTDL